MILRTLIVDDEPLARQGIRLLLQEEKDVEIIAECGNGLDALPVIQQAHPDLMFLDVQMPGLDGFGLLAKLDPIFLPVVIFVTAYDRHALQAFDASATDYLLKPLKPGRFREALARARQQLKSRDLAVVNQRLQTLLAAAQPAANYPTQLSIKSGERTFFIKINDVDYIEAAANYVILHIGTQNHVLRETLTNLESKLSPKLFLRVHRSVIVNLERVVGVKPALRGEYRVVLKNGRELPLTRGVREIQQRVEFL